LVTSNYILYGVRLSALALFLSHLLLKRQTNETPVCQVEFSPNSQFLATSISSRSSQPQVGVRIWNAGQGTLQQVTRSGLKYVNRLAFSPDSSVLGFITGNSQLHLWNLSTRKLQAKLQAVDGNYVMLIVDIVFNPNRQEAIAFAYDGGIFSRIYQWQIKSGKLQSSSELPIDRTDSLLALCPDGQTYVYGGDVTGYHIGNFQSGKVWQFPQNLSPKSGQTQVVFSPDAQQMVIALGNRTMRDRSPNYEAHSCTDRVYLLNLCLCSIYTPAKLSVKPRQ